MDGCAQANHSGTDRYRLLTPDRPSPFRKGAACRVVTMARPSQLESARLRRDLALARARRLTIYSAVGATAFTGVIGLMAATSLPGHSITTAPATQPGATDNSGSTQPGLSAPIQQPQYAYGGAPVAVSGGS